MSILSGYSDNFPYSLSRWTDVVATPSKFEWLKVQLAQGWMVALDPNTGIPSKWSLRPEDTLSLVFWTKDPRNLLLHSELFKDYKVKVHITVTGWTEVEHGAPDIKVGTELLTLATRFFGAANVTWRFSPIPLVSDIYDRFEYIMKRAARVGVRQVFVSFMQPNDRLIDTRDPKVRLRTLKYMGFIAEKHNVTVRLCQDDASLLAGAKPMTGLTLGVCAPPENFERLQLVEKCGCAKAVDPFSLNEACGFACEYCYTNDKQISTKKHNTTHLPVIL